MLMGWSEIMGSYSWADICIWELQTTSFTIQIMGALTVLNHFARNISSQIHGLPEPQHYLTKNSGTRVKLNIEIFQTVWEIFLSHFYGRSFHQMCSQKCLEFYPTTDLFFHALN